MTEIEQKALVLLNKVQDEHGYVQGSRLYRRDRNVFSEALCRAIEQHEATKQELSAFKQKVSDVVVDTEEKYNAAIIRDNFGQFIIPKPKPDPLAELLEEIRGEGGFDNYDHYAHKLRAALEARGLEIREKGEMK